MPATITFHPDANYVECVLSGKLDKRDYEQLGPQFNHMVQQYGKLRLLALLRDFHGWTMGGLWEDIKVDVAHYRDIERLAIVGAKRWHKGMATFCKPFTTATVKYFNSTQLDEARKWLSADHEAVAAECVQSPGEGI